MKPQERATSTNNDEETKTTSTKRKRSSNKTSDGDQASTKKKAPTCLDYIEQHIITKYDHLLVYKPTSSLPFTIVSTDSQALMRDCPKHLTLLYEMELKERHETHYKTHPMPIGFDAEYHHNFQLTTIQLSTHSICFVFEIEKHNKCPEELMTFLGECYKLGVGVAMDCNRLLEQKTEENNECMDHVVDLSHVAKQYHLFGSSLVSLKYLSVQLLKMENIKKDKSKRSQIEYAALDAWIGYECIYKLYEIMTSELFAEWIVKYSKTSNDRELMINEDSTDSLLLKTRSLTTIKDLSKLNPNATEKEKEELMSMRSTYMDMVYGNKKSLSQTNTSQAANSTQARLRKMAHKNSSHRTLTNLVDSMKRSKQEQDRQQVKKDEVNTEQVEKQEKKQTEVKKRQPQPKKKKDEKKQVNIKANQISFTLV